MTIEQWLKETTETLMKNDVDSARLDAELILSHTIRKHRTHLHAHGDDILEANHESIADARLELRLENTPIAYIIGHKEFYGRRFKTTPAALIPRPESETIITSLYELMPKNLPLLPVKPRLIDVGTGTGCLGITAKLEWPELEVTAIDTSVHALTLAKENAAIMQADIHFLKNNLLGGYGLPADFIIANLPYVDKQWIVSPDTHAEPADALYASQQGLSLIFKLLNQALLTLSSGGHIILESDPRQQHKIIEYAKSLGYEHRKTEGFVTVFHFQPPRHVTHQA